MIRFDVVAGFLGAGKTTLLKKLLQTCAERHEKVVVIENEFGEVSIDSEILRIEGFDIYELSQGCVCCSLKKDFYVTLKNIIQDKPDRIIFEPSGIFIIDELFDLFHDPQIAEACFMNSVTTIVDGKNFFNHREIFPRFFESQISHASTILISKGESINPGHISSIEKALHQSAPEIPVISSNWQDLTACDLMMILDGNTKYAFSDDVVLDTSQSGRRPGHDHRSFQSIGIRTARIFQENELARILQSFAAADFGDLLRGKGIINTADGFLQFSYVAGQYEIFPTPPVDQGIVSLIGASLNRAQIQALFS